MAVEENLSYWEYEISVMNLFDGATERYCGTISGQSITDALKTLYKFYGEDKIDILYRFNPINQPSSTEWKFTQQRKE